MKRAFFVTAVSLAIIAGLSGTALALTGYKTAFNTAYGTTGTALDTCSLCHPGGVTSASNLNNFARDYASNSYNFTTIQNLDSDTDGFTNIAEITARTFPGDAASHPAVSDTTAPLVTAFAIPATSASLTVAITTLTATDATGVTGYLVTETSATPAASAAGWSAAKPASYLFASAGVKTLYGWAKDAAGNVGGPLSAGTTITLPDVTAPLVTGFTVPASATSLTVAITTLTATDATGVTGYLVTETSATPAASAAGWSAAKPASYLFASAGVKTLYGWAKDAAGNVGGPLSAATTITLPDVTAPVVTGFIIPASATSLTVAITTLTATDATGVTGYLVTETSATPLASAAGWSAAKPASYLFASAGVKTLYGWAKDAAGNVGGPLSAATTITLADTTAPLVTGFTIPASATSLTVAITTLTATDATGVTGYLVTESSSIPLPSAAGWSAAKPASYTFASAGAKTLYGWAKDSAGNVSAPLDAATTITLADTTAPVITAFAVPASATSLTVAISSFTATDSTGVTGYLVTESSATPSPSATGWSSAAPTSFTFGSAGAKTLYGWAKDAAGNIGGALSSVVITVSDAAAPVITGFAIPATSASLTVLISAFTATDDTGVTGYLVTENSGTPSVSASGWAGTAPASFTFSSAGAQTLYGWVKDAAGNMSGATSSVVITVSDNTAPMVTMFDIPSSSRSFTVTVREFTATDDVRVTGYLITETAQRPRASSSRWRTTPPASYTFRDRSSAGVKRLYAWAKDAAGSISASVSHAVNITARPTHSDDGDRDDEEDD